MGIIYDTMTKRQIIIEYENIFGYDNLFAKLCKDYVYYCEVELSRIGFVFLG